MSAHHERLLPGAPDHESATEHLHRYAFAREVLRGRDVLDLACGEGYGAALLAQTARSVIGVDIDEQAVRAAREKYRRENLEFRTGSATAVPLEAGAVDAVTSFETLEHLREHEEMLREFKRVLRPGGMLVISTPERAEYTEAAQYQNPFHVGELRRAEFLELLRRHFAQFALLGQNSVQGSLLAALDSEGGRGLLHHAGTFDEVSVEAGLRRPRFLIAACSDAVLPPLPTSFFDGAAEPMEQDARAQVLRVGESKRGPWWRRYFGGKPALTAGSVELPVRCRIRSFSVALTGASPTGASEVRARSREKVFTGRIENGRYELFANLGSGTHPVTLEFLKAGTWEAETSLRVVVPAVHFKAR